jgi:hypothetical protein
MDTRVEPAHDDRARVNGSLILFIKMADFTAAIGRGLAVTVVR